MGQFFGKDRVTQAANKQTLLSFSIFIGNDTPVIIKGVTWYNAALTFLMKKYSLNICEAFDILTNYPKTIIINSHHVVLGDIIIIQND